MAVGYVLRIELPDRSEVKEVPGERLRIGRDPSADLFLEASEVSAEHAYISQEDGGYVLFDQGSRTGTYIDDKRIGKLLLFDGDRITMGPFVLQIQLGGPEDPVVVEVGKTEIQAGSRVESERIDYVRAYCLNRPWLNKTLVSVAVVLLTTAVLGALLWEGKTEIFRPGPVSDAHAIVTNQCTRCHVPWHGPSDQACLGCHLGPLHHADQAFSPSCGACHAEHRAQGELAAVVNQQCVSCHGDLEAKPEHSASFARTITHFAVDHPQFAIYRQTESGEQRVTLSEKMRRSGDTAQIRFNHHVHLKEKLTSPTGPVALRCSSCHTVGNDGLLMIPVRYETHCATCHLLDFDPRWPSRQVPHGEPEIVRSYLIRAYAELEEEAPVQGERRRLAGKLTVQKLSPAIIEKVEETQELIFSGARCKKCHMFDTTENGLPSVRKPRIPMNWFRHANFGHKAHRMLQCASCHVDVLKSTSTSDVLLPGIETCRSCHRSHAPSMLLQTSTASADCVTCHLYHDKTIEADLLKPLTVIQVLEPQVHPDPGKQEPSYRRYLKALGFGFLGKSR